MAGTEGKKSIRWDQDAEILARLTTVAAMMIQGAKGWQIAEALGYSLRSAYRDIDRVDTMWKREAANSVEQSRVRSIAQYREIQTQAWQQYRSTKKESWLRIAMDAQSQIDALEGTRKPVGVDVTTGGEKLTFNAKELTDDELAAIAAGSRSRTSGKASRS